MMIILFIFSFSSLLICRSAKSTGRFSNFSLLIGQEPLLVSNDTGDQNEDNFKHENVTSDKPAGDVNGYQIGRITISDIHGSEVTFKKTLIHYL